MLPAHFSSDSFITVSLICDSPSQCLITLICLLRKLYWTDGDNISMANMDGSNQTTLFTNQKGPVGEQMCRPEPKNTAAIVTRGCEHGKVLKAIGLCVTRLLFFSTQDSPLTMKKSSCTGSAQETAPLAAVSWTDPNWRSWRVLEANSPRPQHWLLWVRWKKKILVLLVVIENLLPN